MSAADAKPATDPQDEGEVTPDLIAENQRLKGELLTTRIQSAQTHVELLQSRRTTLTVEARLIDTKLLPDAIEKFNNLVKEREALVPKPSE